MKKLDNHAVIDYWAVYDGSMKMDENGNAVYIQNFGTLEGIGYCYIDKKSNCQIALLRASDMTEEEYHQLLKKTKGE